MSPERITSIVHCLGTRLQGSANARSDLDLAGCSTTCANEEPCMADEVLINEAATIERCVARAREDDHRDPVPFATDFTRQDAAILNLQRPCEAPLDMGRHLLRRERLGAPHSARDTFPLVAQDGWIGAGLADGLKRIVGSRNIALHDDQALHLPIMVRIIAAHLDGFLDDRRALPLRDAVPSPATVAF